MFQLKMALLLGLCMFMCLLTRPVHSADPCASNPCQNKGICTSFDGSTFMCKCRSGFFGKRCEKVNDACKVNHCDHGECVADIFGDYHCYCSPGYHGKLCELNHDDCLSSPCQNSALCVDKVDDYECVCTLQGTFGKQCEFHEDDIETCASECPQGSICWRNYTTTFDIPWGYGDNICYTHHSCFGGHNNTVKDYYIDVQLHPVQIQPGDILNFTSDNTISNAIDGLVPRLLPVDVYGDSNSFVNCNTTNGTQLVTSPQRNILINSTELLYPGVHYFIMNIDFTYRCDFGLRLNVSVKSQACRDKISLDDRLCSGRGQCHTNFSLPQYQCKCCPGFRGKYCEKRDYCVVNPCRNQAECINEYHNVNVNYSCRCQPGYEGKHCSIVIDMCKSHPCRNGAICSTSVNAYHCQCAPGYTGRNCEAEINECLAQPCQNNATCVDKLRDFSCICLKGFTGAQCEVNIDECEQNPCEHGVCIDKINGYQCLCHPGYTGNTCNVTMDKCVSTSCLNGGICIDKVDGYLCDCGIGYDGKHCENDINLCNKPEICTNFMSCTDKGNYVNCVCKQGFTGSNCAVNIDECASQPCQFGGKCLDKENGFQCLCTPGYEGTLCEKVNVTFHDPERLCVKFVSDNCYKLQEPAMIQNIQAKVAESIHTSCGCPFTRNNIHNHTTSLQCHDKTSGSLYLHITDVDPYNTEQLICIHQLALTKRENIAISGNQTYEVGVIYNTDRCDEVNRQLQDVEDDSSSSGTIALTVGLVLALVGLFTAAFVVFLKWRKKGKPVKRNIKKQYHKSDDKQVVDTMNLDLLSSVAPTPKSLYGRTNGAAYRNYGFTRQNFDLIETKGI